MRIARMGCEFFIFDFLGGAYASGGLGGEVVCSWGVGGVTKKTALASRHERFRYKK